jgi:hypothetical protein
MPDSVGTGPQWKPAPIDIGKLLTLGRSLVSPQTPAVPALCLRLGRYAARMHSGTHVADLEEWAGSHYEEWLDGLEKNDSEIIEATLITDPANLILGAKSLNDPALATKCMRAQLSLYDRCKFALPRMNQTIIAAIIGPDGVQDHHHLLRDPLTATELAQELSPLSCAALALMSQNGLLDTRPGITQEEMTAVSLRSVWMRDLSGIGLSLLASKVLFGGPTPSSLLAWIERVERSDGFFGMWELYAECHAIANLLGTVNIYWGLSTSVSEYSPDLAENPRIEFSGQQCEKSIARAQSWLDAHEKRFHLLPTCRDEDQFETRFKPLVELSLLCYVLTSERHRSALAPWAAWAKSMANRLFPHVEWEGLMEAFRLQTSATLGIAIYPFLIGATGKTTRFAREARALLEDPFAQAQERTPMREMDYQFTRQIMGNPLAGHEVSAQFKRTLMRLPFDPLLMDNDALYDLTHAVLYATMFGNIPWIPLSDEMGSWLRKWLIPMTLARFLMGDADLGSELLLVLFYTQPEDTEHVAGCIRRLLDFQEPDGAFTGPQGTPDGADEFDANYHTTLVAIAALTDAVALGNRAEVN